MPASPSHSSCVARCSHQPSRGRMEVVDRNYKLDSWVRWRVLCQPSEVLGSSLRVFSSPMTRRFEGGICLAPQVDQ